MWKKRFFSAMSQCRIPDLCLVGQLMQVTMMLHNISIMFGDSMEDLEIDAPANQLEQPITVADDESEEEEKDDEIEIKMPRIMTRTLILERFYP